MIVWFPQVDYRVEARLVAMIRIKAATTHLPAKKVTGCVPAYYGPTLVPSDQIVMGRSNSRDGQYENLDLHFFVSVAVLQTGRERELKSCAWAIVRDRPEPAAVPINNGTADSQPQP